MRSTICASSPFDQSLRHDALHDDIERAGGFVGDDDGWVQGDAHGDADTLLHAAAEFMGVHIVDAVGQAYVLEQLKDAFPHGFFVALFALVGFDDIDDLIFDAHGRVERVHRALRDERQAGPTELAQLFFAEVQHFGAVDFNAAVHDITGRLDQLQDAVSCCRFAAAAFADQAERLAFVEIEADIADGDDIALRRGVMDAQVIDLEDDAVFYPPFPSPFLHKEGRGVISFRSPSLILGEGFRVGVQLLGHVAWLPRASWLCAGAGWRSRPSQG